jgi:hypothetical protein
LARRVLRDGVTVATVSMETDCMTTVEQVLSYTPIPRLGRLAQWLQRYWPEKVILHDPT